MIDSLSHISAQQIFNTNLAEHAKLKGPEFGGAAQGLAPVAEPGKSFDGVIGKFVQQVDAKDKAAIGETNRMLLGETDNIHQSMIAMQEAGLAFNLMVEVRNKLMQSYQELIKMPV